MSACAGLELLPSPFAEEEDKTANWSAGDYYKEAKKQMDDENYTAAIELFQKLEARYPFGTYAQQSQVDLAYSYYKDSEPDSALSTANRFIRVYPRYENIDYLYYLKGLINFNRGIGLFERYLPTDKTQRDPGATSRSLGDFETLLRRFPNSQYAADSKQRIIALHSNLALYDLNVAQYYMKRGAYIAVVNRCKNIIEKYPKTTAVPRALLLMSDAYKRLGMADLAKYSQRVYNLNYPKGMPPLYKVDDREKTSAESVWEYLELDK
ncbi:MAG: competence protein ComL [Cycloclasticus sp. symbiont of Poecilosclerida sp. M]|nr:MAG: competence protein ComL [Cycloclasticus sp. symbiont of Poecilosclerida sp. M]